jgi:hypothetical protein
MTLVLFAARHDVAEHGGRLFLAAAPAKSFLCRYGQGLGLQNFTFVRNFISSPLRQQNCLCLLITDIILTTLKTESTPLQRTSPNFGWPRSRLS